MPDDRERQPPEPEPEERPYEPPRVEDVPAQDGPAVTAAGDTPATGPEWQPPEPPPS